HAKWELNGGRSYYCALTDMLPKGASSSDFARDSLLGSWRSIGAALQSYCLGAVHPPGRTCGDWCRIAANFGYWADSIDDCGCECLHADRLLRRDADPKRPGGPLGVQVILLF